MQNATWKLWVFLFLSSHFCPFVLQARALQSTRKDRKTRAWKIQCNIYIWWHINTHTIWADIHICPVQDAMFFFKFYYYFIIQLATPQMTCSSCGRQETLCKWMKLLYHSLTSDRKISIMETAPNTMQEQVQPVFIILYIMCRFFGESVLSVLKKKKLFIKFEQIFMIYLGNVDSSDCDILDSGGTLTFDHPKIISQGQRPQAFCAQSWHDQCSSSEKSEKC